MILNNRLGFPVTTGGKKSENDIPHFAVNIFLRFWGCFLKDWIIKKSHIYSWLCGNAIILKWEKGYIYEGICICGN